MFKSNSLAKRIFAGALSAVLIFSLALTGCDETDSEDSDDEESSTSETTESEVEIADVPDAISSEHYQISLAFLSYMFNDIYDTYATYWAYYYGYDSSLDLKEQYTPDESSTTWYDYLLTLVKEQIQQILVFAEAALDEGIELTEDEQNSITEQLETLSETAEESGLTIEEYIEEQCGSGVTEDDIQNYSEVMQLAQNYYTELSESFEYMDEDYDEYYEENTESFLYADYCTYTFQSTLDDDATDDELEEEMERLKVYADELAECTTEEEFQTYMTQYYNDNPELITGSEDDDDYEEMDDDEFEEAVEEEVESLTTTKYSYELSSTGGIWLFDDERSAGDTTIIEGDDYYCVILALQTAYRDESVGKNVRHILFMLTSYDSDEEALEAAEEVYEEWKSGEMTEETFSVLATKYSEDTGSSSEGGLYENIEEGDMVTEFNDWCFDESREPGDNEIILTTYGYHIMYFVGDGDPAWKVTADTAMRSDDSYAVYEELVEQYEVTFDDDALSTLDLV